MESVKQLRVPFEASSGSLLSQIVRHELAGSLAERSRVIRDGVPRQDQGFVLYWMRTALRAHENPALDLALELTRQLDKPVVVYHALGERYLFASDRHHWFLLEGAVDVAREPEERAIGHVFYLEWEGHPGPFFRAMADEAAVMVTEDMPVASLVGWTEVLARRAEVRMTWGKALPGWTRNAAEAVGLLEDLSLRYALDGRDPASYGGILWCLGQFDRPFTPERPILGAVRSRSTRFHARRVEVGTDRTRVEASAFEDPPSVLVIGAGIAGLTCAETLSDAGFEVRVVDKGRGPGGRLSTRRRDEHRFDHGAQFFTARDPRFQRHVESWIHEGQVSEWKGRILSIGPEGREPARPSRRFVGSPKMSSLGRILSEGLDVRLGRRVTGLHRNEGKRWTATLEDGSELSADVCVLTTPARQAVDLLPSEHGLRKPLGHIEMAPCIALMVAFDQTLDVDFDGAFVSGSPLGWVARDSSKPGRPEGERWVLHASPEWSAEHLERDPESLTAPLLGALEVLAGRALPACTWQSVHRWRYARALRSLGVDHLFDSESGLLYAGDGCLGSRVEDAYLSGVAAAGALLRSLSVARSE